MNRPKKTKKSALDDPELVKAVEDKLAAFRLSSPYEEEGKEKENVPSAGGMSSGGVGTAGTVMGGGASSGQGAGEGLPLRPSQAQSGA